MYSTTGKIRKGVSSNAVILKLLIKGTKDSREEWKGRAQQDPLVSSPEHPWDSLLPARRAAGAESSPSNTQLLSQGADPPQSPHPGALPLRCLLAKQSLKTTFHSAYLTKWIWPPNSGEAFWLVLGAPCCSTCRLSQVLFAFSSDRCRGTSAHLLPNWGMRCRCCWVLPMTLFWEAWEHGPLNRWPMGPTVSLSPSYSDYRAKLLGISRGSRAS